MFSSRQRVVVWLPSNSSANIKVNHDFRWRSAIRVRCEIPRHRRIKPVLRLAGADVSRSDAIRAGIPIRDRISALAPGAGSGAVYDKLFFDGRATAGAVSPNFSPISGACGLFLQKYPVWKKYPSVDRSRHSRSDEAGSRFRRTGRVLTSDRNAERVDQAAPAIGESLLTTSSRLLSRRFPSGERS